MTRVLFVCTANIARSAYAQVRATQLAPAVDFSSAGTHGWTDHPMDDPMAAELVRRGADPTGFRSRRLTRQMVDDADVVLTATAEHRTYVLQERPTALRKAFTLGQLAEALAELPPGAAPSPGVPVTDLLRAAHRLRATAAPEHDVLDPYGRGTEAAGRAAEHIDELLGRVLPHLAETSHLET